MIRGNIPIPLHIDGIDLASQGERYREIAKTLRGNSMVERYVSMLVLELYASRDFETDAADMLAVIKAAIQVDGEDKGMFPTDFNLRQIAGAIMSDALELLSRIPAKGGRA